MAPAPSGGEHPEILAGLEAVGGEEAEALAVHEDLVAFLQLRERLVKAPPGTTTEKNSRCSSCAADAIE
jgi:hypothetical protein